MSEKKPVVLAVIIETVNQKWFVAGIPFTGQPIPLLCSDPGNLSPYVGLEFDEQVSFLRHRLSGVLQRGCDRLWGRMMKARQIVFLTDGDFADASEELTKRVAEHFAEWMSRPPVAFYRCQQGWPAHPDTQLNLLAGTIDDQSNQALRDGLPTLIHSLSKADLWELVKTKPTA